MLVIQVDKLLPCAPKPKIGWRSLTKPKLLKGFYHSLGFRLDWTLFLVFYVKTAKFHYVWKWAVIVRAAFGREAFEWACSPKLSLLPADSCLGKDFG